MADSGNGKSVGRANGKRVKKRRKGPLTRAMDRKRAKRKQRFLKKFFERGMVSVAAKEVGLSDNSLFYKWMKNDPLFAASVAVIREEVKKRMDADGRRRTRERMHVVLYYGGLPIFYPGGRRPTEVCGWSDAYLMFRLRMMKPEVYGKA